MEDNKLSKKFDESAKKILINSQKIAISMGVQNIGTEHLLMAILNAPETLACKILKEYSISVEHVRLALSLNLIDRSKSSGLSQDYKKTITAGSKIALDLGNALISPEHLLVAMMLEKTVARDIIEKLRIDPNDIINKLDGELADDLEEPEPINFEPGQDLTEIFPGKSFFGQKNNSLIGYFTHDLTNSAKKGELDPIIGRDTEIKRAIQILSRRTKNNPILIGEPGVGKTAIVEGLAQSIASGTVPKGLKNKKILSLDLAAVVAGTMYRGQFEERVKKIVDEISGKDYIIFLDEIHTIVGAGAVEGSIDAANILKPALQKGRIKLIGATTLDEYRKHIEKDPALERRFQQIIVDEPNEEETLKILKGIKKKYEKYHNVQITDKALAAAVSLGKKYINDRFLPDKSIDLIDEASAAKNIDSESDQIKKIQDLEKEIKKTTKLKEKEISTRNFDAAIEWRKELTKLEKELAKLIHSDENCLSQIVDEEDIAQVVSQWTRIPMVKIVKNEQKKLMNLEDRLKAKIIGQDEAVDSIASAIRRSKARISDPKRPIGSFIFLGPTGVGKTELAKVLATEIYGRESVLIKIDMSEFMERHNISRLVGAPPGYVGYEESGKLTEQVRRNPYSIILLDEIEKAHPEFFNLMLQVLEDGYLTDAKGRKVSFRNTIIIMTSNIGLTDLTRQAAIGFSKNFGILGAEYESIKAKVLDKLKDQFRPEFYNRIDKIIVFKPLDKISIAKIVELQFEELNKRLNEQGYNLEVSNEVKDYIAEKSFDPKLGARPIRRNITDYVENILSEFIIANLESGNSKIYCHLKSGQILLTKR